MPTVFEIAGLQGSWCWGCRAEARHLHGVWV